MTSMKLRTETTCSCGSKDFYRDGTCAKCGKKIQKTKNTTCFRCNSKTPAFDIFVSGKNERDTGTYVVLNICEGCLTILDDKIMKG